MSETGEGTPQGQSTFFSEVFAFSCMDVVQASRMMLVSQALCAVIESPAIPVYPGRSRLCFSTESSTPGKSLMQRNPGQLVSPSCGTEQQDDTFGCAVCGKVTIVG